MTFRSATAKVAERASIKDFADRLTTLTADGECLPCQKRAEEATLSAKESDPRWAGVLGVEGEMTGDGRFIEVDALRWSDLPIPIRYVGADVGAHDGAQVVGLIDRIERREVEGDKTKRVIWGEGIFDMDAEAGREAARVVQKRTMNGVSMDLDEVTFEVRVASELDPKVTELAGEKGIQLKPGADSIGNEDADGRRTITKVAPTDEVTVTTDGRVRATTIVAIPAFASARIALNDEAVEADAAEDSEDSGALDDEDVDTIELTPKELVFIEKALLEDDTEADVVAVVAAGTETFNWVEDAGGLPRYVKRIAKHLRAKGMTESHAIATAVNVVKKMCATGDVNWPGKQDVNAGSRAEACAALARWEAMKASHAVEGARFRDFTPKQRDNAAKEGTALPDGSFPIKNLTDLKNAIQAIGRAKDPAKARAHIKKRARALGHEDLIPKDWAARDFIQVFKKRPGPPGGGGGSSSGGGGGGTSLKEDKGGTRLKQTGSGPVTPGGAPRRIYHEEDHPRRWDGEWVKKGSSETVDTKEGGRARRAAGGDRRKGKGKGKGSAQAAKNRAEAARRRAASKALRVESARQRVLTARKAAADAIAAKRAADEELLFAKEDAARKQARADSEQDGPSLAAAQQAQARYVRAQQSVKAAAENAKAARARAAELEKILKLIRKLASETQQMATGSTEQMTGETDEFAYNPLQWRNPNNGRWIDMPHIAIRKLNRYFQGSKAAKSGTGRKLDDDELDNFDEVTAHLRSIDMDTPEGVEEYYDQVDELFGTLDEMLNDGAFDYSVDAYSEVEDYMNSLQAILDLGSDQFYNELQEAKAAAETKNFEDPDASEPEVGEADDIAKKGDEVGPETEPEPEAEAEPEEAAEAETPEASGSIYNSSDDLPALSDDAQDSTLGGITDILSQARQSEGFDPATDRSLIAAQAIAHGMNTGRFGGMFNQWLRGRGQDGDTGTAENGHELLGRLLDSDAKTEGQFLREMKMFEGEKLKEWGETAAAAKDKNEGFGPTGAGPEAADTKAWLAEGLGISKGWNDFLNGDSSPAQLQALRDGLESRRANALDKNYKDTYKSMVDDIDAVINGETAPEPEVEPEGEAEVEVEPAAEGPEERTPDKKYWHRKPDGTLVEPTDAMVRRLKRIEAAIRKAKRENNGVLERRKQKELEELLGERATEAPQLPGMGEVAPEPEEVAPEAPEVEESELPAKGLSPAAAIQELSDITAGNPEILTRAQEQLDRAEDILRGLEGLAPDDYQKRLAEAAETLREAGGDISTDTSAELGNQIKNLADRLEGGGESPPPPEEPEVEEEPEPQEEGHNAPGDITGDKGHEPGDISGDRGHEPGEIAGPEAGHRPPNTIESDDLDLTDDDFAEVEELIDSFNTDDVKALWGRLDEAPSQERKDLGQAAYDYLNEQIEQRGIDTDDEAVRNLAEELIDVYLGVDEDREESEEPEDEEPEEPEAEAETEAEPEEEAAPEAEAEPEPAAAGGTDAEEATMKALLDKGGATSRKDLINAFVGNFRLMFPNSIATDAQLREIAGDYIDSYLHEKALEDASKARDVTDVDTDEGATPGQTPPDVIDVDDGAPPPGQGNTTGALEMTPKLIESILDEAFDENGHDLDKLTDVLFNRLMEDYRAAGVDVDDPDGVRATARQHAKEYLDIKMKEETGEITPAEANRQRAALNKELRGTMQAAKSEKAIFALLDGMKGLDTSNSKGLLKIIMDLLKRLLLIPIGGGGMRNIAQGMANRYKNRNRGRKMSAIIAGGGPVAPPRAWFINPNLTEVTPLQVTDDGRVYGHLATWDVCHIGQRGKCVTAPRSNANYAYFRTGYIKTVEGVELAVGQITLDTGHASQGLSAKSTMAHYDNTGKAVADVACGEDAYGIWVAGALRPDISDKMIRVLRASPLSGDWREMRGNLELVAALSVNVQGFPIPRPAGLVAGGQMRSLVASGMIPPKRVIPPGQPGSLSDDDLRYLKALAQRERDSAAQALKAKVNGTRQGEFKARAQALREKVLTYSTDKQGD